MSEMTLRLPNNYIQIDIDEMEYVDGGFAVTERWYGYDVYLNASDCGDLAALAAGAGITYATVSAVLGL